MLSNLLTLPSRLASWALLLAAAAVGVYGYFHRDAAFSIYPRLPIPTVGRYGVNLTFTPFSWMLNYSPSFETPAVLVVDEGEVTVTQYVLLSASLGPLSMVLLRIEDA